MYAIALRLQLVMKAPVHLEHDPINNTISILTFEQIVLWAALYEKVGYETDDDVN